ncbi:MAG: SRPBCC family protein [Actinobacteria bacterium]|nr:SRPBCC family protein [Actinomycetota bacterium]
MADHSVQRETVVVEAPPRTCVAVATDVERYPEWAPELKEATVLERDAQGHPLRVAFRAAAFGRSTEYRLRYNYSGLPDRISWVLEDGDITRKLDGAYTFVALEGEPDRTEMIYELEVELVMPLPGVVKNRTERKIIHTAIQDLKARVEAVHSAAQA